MSLGHQGQTLTTPWSWTLGNHWRNVITSTSGRDGILRRVHGVTLHDKVCSCEICEALNVEPRVFFNENVRNPVWICRDPISPILGTRFSWFQGPDFSDFRDPIFSDIRDPIIIFYDSRDRFEILGTRIGSLKHLKKTCWTTSLPNLEIPATLVRPCVQMSQERLARQVLLATPTGKRPRVVQGPGGVTTSPTLLGPVLVCQKNYL